MTDVNDADQPSDETEPTLPLGARDDTPGDEPLAIPAAGRPGESTAAAPGTTGTTGTPGAGAAWPPPPPSEPPPGWAAHRPSAGDHRAGDHRPAPGAPRWMWPVVCVLALVLGLLGGVGGALLHDQISGDVGADGRTTGGLGDVDLQDRAPLKESGSVAAVAEEMVPSTVRIIASVQGQNGGATGSGFVFDKQGHIVTNNHVVADAAADDGAIQVVDQDGRHLEARVVGRSPVYDLALLYAEEAKDLKPAALGRSQQLLVGDPVVAIGYPLGLNTTVTSGIVSALGQPVSTGNTEDDSSYINAVQTDAAINPGNSGGPLVNRRGQVIGVNSAIATNGGGSVDGTAGNIGVGFAIPVEQVLVTVDQILRDGEAEYPVIGAKVQTGGVQDFAGGELVEIIDGSPSEDAGLQKGDVVTEVNGEPVSDGLDLIVTIRSYQPGETIEFTVDRGGDEQKVDVTLDGEVG
jgi:putative serine protease PepD